MPKTKTTWTKDNPPTRKGKAKGIKNKVTRHREAIINAELSVKDRRELVRHVYNVACSDRPDAAKYLELLLKYMWGEPPREVTITTNDRAGLLPDGELGELAMSMAQRMVEMKQQKELPTIATKTIDATVTTTKEGQTNGKVHPVTGQEGTS